MRYVIARYTAFQRDMGYRFYISDCLRIISENTARMAGNGSTYMQKHFSDIVFSTNETAVKEGTAKASIISKLKGG